jgi:hypothetical protein
MGIVILVTIDSQSIEDIQRMLVIQPAVMSTMTMDVDIITDIQRCVDVI